MSKQVSYTANVNPNLKVNITIGELQNKIDQAKKEALDEIQQLIIDEILICHHENQPTSRLTSLANKIRDLR